MLTTDLTTKLAESLHEISLCSQKSGSSKEECGRIAREALRLYDAAKVMFPKRISGTSAQPVQDLPPLPLPCGRRNDGRELFHADQMRDYARAAMAATPAAEPQGWKLVPVEPTPEMTKAADNYAFVTDQRPKGMWWWGRIYEAMLAAAPEAGQGKEASNERD